MQHDLLKDPYPAECDLIVCRNVLIYFTDEAKNRIYNNFHNALKNNGILFVGKYESRCLMKLDLIALVIFKAKCSLLINLFLLYKRAIR